MYRVLCGHSFSSSGQIPGSMIARSQGKSMFDFVRNYQTVQKWLCHVAFIPASSLPALVLSVFQVTAILIGVYLSVLICISLITSVTSWEELTF